MSRSDLVHLLEDSIEKSSMKTKDRPIKNHCESTKKFIIRTAKDVEKDLNMQKERNKKFWGNDLN